MGLLLELLKAAAGEASLHSALGLWRQHVSQQLDTGSAAPADYINSKNLNEQTTVDATDNLAVETDINARGITRPDAFSFQLVAGRTYHLQAHMRFTDFTESESGRLSIRWVDDSNTSIPDPGAGPDAIPAEFFPVTSADAKTFDPVVDVIYTVPASPASGSIVRLRCVASTGTATLPANGCSVSIIEIK